LVDCVRGGKDTCSQGGEMYDGEEYGSTHGMELETDYSYQGTSGHKCAFDASKVVHKFSGYTNITSGDENALKQAAYEQPIVSVGIDASSIWFQLYFGGVFNLKSCSTTNLYHGVSIVGYGSINVKGVNTDFWMVRNSWGSMWGMSGYIMTSRNKNNQCGIATQASFAKL
jgi:cathepsin L